MRDYGYRHSLRYGDHVLWLRNRVEDRHEVLGRFVCRGIAANDRVLCIESAHSPTRIVRHLNEEGPRAETILASGQLRMTSDKALGLSADSFDLDKTAELLRAERDLSLAQGYKGLRIAIDMQWTAVPRLQVDALLKAETMLDGLCCGAPCIVMCEYDPLLFDPRALLRLTAAHPLIIYGNELLENIYHVPATGAKGAERAEAVLDQRMQTLRRRREVERSAWMQRLAFSSLPDALILVDAHGRILEWNPAAQRMFGYSREEMLGKSPDALYGSSDAQQPVSRILEICSQQGKWAGEIDYFRKDGPRGICEMTAAPIRDADGRLAFTVIANRDIASRKQMEASLSCRDRIIHAIVLAAEGVMEEAGHTDVVQRILARLGEATSVSRVHVFENHESADGTLLTSQRFEWAAEGIASLRDNPALQNSDWHSVGLARWLKLFQRNEPVFGPVESLPRSERLVLEAQGIRSIAAVPINSGGALWGFVSFDDCVDERTWTPPEIDALRVAAGFIGETLRFERARIALTRSESLYRRVVEDQVDLICRFTADCRLTFVNEAYARCFGLSPEELIGRDFLKFIPAEEHDRVKELIAALAPERPFATIEHRVFMPDGSTQWQQWTDRAILDAQGRVVEIQAVGRDITNIKLREEELCRSRDELHTLFAQRARTLDVVCENLREEIARHEKTRVALENSIGRWHTTFDSINDAIFLTDMTGRIVLCNRSAGALAGRPIPEALGQVCCHVLHGDAARVDNCPFASMEKSGQTSHAEVEMRGRWYCVTVDPLHDEKREIIGSVHIISDITERHRADEELRRAEAKYRRLVEQLPGITYTLPLGESHAAAYMSPQIQRLLGYSLKDWAAVPGLWEQVIHPEDRARVAAELESCIRTSSPFLLDYRMVTSTGQVRWFRDRAVVSLETPDSPVLLGFCSDITDIKRFEDSLRAAEELFRNVTQTALSAVVCYDHEGRVLVWNHAAEELFGYAREDILGRPFDQVIPEEKRKHFRTQQAHPGDMDRKERGRFFETSIRRKDGSIFPVEVSYAEWTHGANRFSTAIFNDISVRRSLEREVLEISEKERRMIGQELHDDLGQRLSGIGLLCRSLRNKLSAGGRPELALAQEIGALVENVLDRVRALARGLTPVEHRADGLMEALEQLVHDTQALTGITCTFARDADVLVEDDTVAGNLYRIAQEAVRNAATHGRPGRITVHLEASRGRVCLTVTDDGCGFEKKDPAGRGLGLAIMAYRAKFLGGDVELESRPGKGTTVRCEYPLIPDRKESNG